MCINTGKIWWKFKFHLQERQEKQASINELKNIIRTTLQNENWDANEGSTAKNTMFTAKERYVEKTGKIYI